MCDDDPLHKPFVRSLFCSYWRLLIHKDGFREIKTKNGYLSTSRNKLYVNIKRSYTWKFNQQFVPESKSIVYNKRHVVVLLFWSTWLRNRMADSTRLAMRFVSIEHHNSNQALNSALGHFCSCGSSFFSRSFTLFSSHRVYFVTWFVLVSFDKTTITIIIIERMAIVHTFIVIWYSF